MKTLLLAALLSSFCAEPDSLMTIPELLQSASLTESRFRELAPITEERINKSAITSQAPAASLPMQLSLLPSVTSMNEGGTGLGYSRLSIRGVSGYQTGVTLNGITLNDAESQEVFWVNIPAAGNMSDYITVQRGLGSNGNGSGAFGANILMETVPYNRTTSMNMVQGALGSFGTRSLLFDLKPRMVNGYWVDVQGSLNGTDGYIRNAFANTGSLFLSGGHNGVKDEITVNVIYGRQHSGITWEGIPLELYNAGERTCNPAGMHFDAEGNVQYYDNQSDNYSQTHLQAIWKHRLNEKMSLNLTYNLSLGNGYYEQYETAFTSEGDAIVRYQMKNTLNVLRAEYKRTGKKNSYKAGAYISLYDGNHFGTDITTSPIEFYRNASDKNDFDFWVRTDHRITKRLYAYSDTQYRLVRHVMNGPDEYGQALAYRKTNHFTNPRGGFTYLVGADGKLSFSYGLGHREAARSDIQSDLLNNGRTTIRPEKMHDYELSYEYNNYKWKAGATLYFMEYRDLLLETGQLDKLGYLVKTNVPKAHRRGLELHARRQTNALTIEGNFSLSRNALSDGTPLRMSPAAVGSIRAEYRPGRNFRLGADAKYTGRQYWDNTGCSERSIPSYSVVNAMAGKTIGLSGTHKLDISLYINNLLDRDYYADAWVYREQQPDGSIYQSEGLFPQAPRNWSVKLTYMF